MANNNDKFISRENAKTLWGYMIDLLTGKQNKLTFDDTPTQSSDNPVKSGGIFTALAGKGTYSKPQNGIPKTDLENAVQTSLGLADSALQSETDPTVPSWAKQTNKPAYNSDEISDDNRTHKFATDTQLQQISTNQANILSIYNQNGKTFNLLNFDAWANQVGLNHSNAVKLVSKNSISLTSATNDGVYTLFSAVGFPVSARIPVTAGDTIHFSWNYSESAAGMNTNVYLFGNGDASKSIYTSGSTGHLSYLVPSGVTFITWRVGVENNQSGRTATWSNMQIITQSALDAGFSGYASYSLPNTTITNELVELVDGGSKNIAYPTVASGTYYTNVTVTVAADGKIKATSSVNTTGTINVWVPSTPYTCTTDMVVLSPVKDDKPQYIVRYTDPYGTEQYKRISTNATNGGYIIPAGSVIKYLYIQENTGGIWDFEGYIMVCSLAAWNVSHKYVPHRLPYDTVAYRAKCITTMHCTAIAAEGTDKTVTLNIPTTDTFSLFCLTNEASVGSLSMVAVLGSNRYGGIDTATQTYGLIVNNNTVTVKVKAYNQALLIWNKDLDISWS